MMPPAWSSATDAVIPVESPADVVLAGLRARSLARALGFSRRAQWEIATAVSEAATNMLKFAGRGKVVLNPLTGGVGGLEFHALDEGPGIADPEAALRDGVSEGHDLAREEKFVGLRVRGCGLPAIRRLMDGIQIQTRAEGGAWVSGRKYL